MRRRRRQPQPSEVCDASERSCPPPNTAGACSDEIGWTDLVDGEAIPSQEEAGDEQKTKAAEQQEEEEEDLAPSEDGDGTGKAGAVARADCVEDEYEAEVQDVQPVWRGPDLGSWDEGAVPGALGSADEEHSSYPQYPAGEPEEEYDDDDPFFMICIVVTCVCLVGGAAAAIFMFGFSLEGQHHAGPPGGRHEDRAPDADLELKLTLRQMYSGASMQASYQRQTRCAVCGGSGAAPGFGRVRCPHCHGRGANLFQTPLGVVQQECTRCGGLGSVVERKCPRCHGRRTYHEEHAITARVDPGARDGDKVRVPGQGHQAPGKPEGDAVLHVKLAKEHSRFRREGSDLIAPLRISLAEALAGFNHTVRHVDGHRVTVAYNDSKWLRPGSTMVVAGEGMPLRPLRRSGYPSLSTLGSALGVTDTPQTNGRLRLEVEVAFPKRLTEAQRHGLAEWFEELSA